MRAFDRLRRAGEIAYLRRKGREQRFAAFVVFTAPSSEAHPRIGVVVSRAVGGAVARNRVRRRIRGALERLAEPPTERMLFVARPPAAGIAAAALASDIARAVSGAS